MGGDSELTIWLAKDVLGKVVEYWDDTAEGALLHTGERFIPLQLLDDARLLEDRLRELGMQWGYYYALVDVMYREKVPDIIEGLLYATARQRCEAVRRTWLQRKESEGT